MNLMIVEDEVRLLYNLAYNIPWEEHDIEVVGTAQNGEEALALIELRNPDIILLDMQMPKMGGLELIAALKQKEHHLRFIILSGHDDFHYAQAAIQLGVDNYLLKPAGNPEIVIAVKEVAERIKSERESNYNVEMLLQKWQGHLPTLQNEFLRQWVDGKFVDWEVKRYARELMLEKLIQPSLDLLVAVVEMDPLPESESRFTAKDASLLHFSLQSIAKEFLAEVDCHVFSDESNAVLVMFWSSEDDKEKLFHQANIHIVKLLEIVKDCLKLSASAGIGRPVSRSEVALSYRQGQKGLSERVLYGYDIAIPYNPEAVTSNSPQFDSQIERRLQLALETGDSSKAEEMIRQWYREKCEHAFSVEALKEQVLFMLSMLTRLIHAQGWSVHEVVGEELEHFLQPVELVNKGLVLESIERIIRKYMAHRDEQRSSRSNHLIASLLEITEKSVDQDVSLHAIADQLYVHPSYLSRLFKKETGRTFSDYFQEKKMQRAKQLLSDGFKVYETALRIGYRDVSYFTKLYRKYWGMNPSEMFKDN